MKAGDKVELVGMVGIPPEALEKPEVGRFLERYRKDLDEMMVQTLEDVGVIIGDEGIVTATYTDGWADVRFPQRETSIATPQTNLEVVEDQPDFEVDMVIHRMDPVDPDFQVHSIVG